jgi:hypothetical protein
LKLGKYTKIFLFIFDVVLLALIVVYFVRGWLSVDHPMFWIAVVAELGLGWLTYWFWMRSLLVKGFKLDKVLVVILILLGIALPFLFYSSGFEFLQHAGSTDLFYYFSLVSLTIYSHYMVDKFLDQHKLRTLKTHPK